MLRFALFFLPVIAIAQDIRYSIRFPNAIHHEAEIEARFEAVPTVAELHFSRSSPGRYAAHDFAKNVYNVRVTDGAGKALPFTRPNPHTWSVTGHNGTVIVKYTLFGDRADGTYASIDETHALLNAPATWMWMKSLEKRPAVITIEPRPDWKVATQLTPVSANTYRAPHLDYLLDSPIEISNFMLREWTTGDAKFRIALHHKGTEAEATAFARASEAAVIEMEGLFGELAKYDFGNYTFLIDTMPQSSGDGMEHRNSTVISGPRGISDTRTGPLGTVVHEFIHSWNVERIRPRSLEPFNFEDANISEELWFAEGFTTYLTPLVMKRAGLLSIDGFLNQIAGSVNAALVSPGREVFSVSQMSQLAPFADGATSNEPVNYPNTFISYYPYGAAVGLGFDLMIRSEFPGKSVDSWMQAMWARHGRHQANYAPEKPYTMGDLEQALASVTNNEFASRVFLKHVRGKEPIPFAPLLEKAGFLMRQAKPEEAWLGSDFLTFDDKGMQLRGVTLRGTPLYQAGLDRLDRIQELDGRVFKKREDLDAWLKTKKPGDNVKAKVETRTGTREITIALSSSPRLEIIRFEAAGRLPSPDQVSFRNAWLASRAKRPLAELKRYCPLCRRAHPFEFEHCPYDGKELLLVEPPAPAKAASDQASR
jgi:predicted metalloprotease with PDZ domain